MRYLFENYRLDTDRRELHRGGDLVPLEPKAFDLLVYLIDNRERVVSKDDLLAAVWAGRIVSESALTTRINAARSAVGDNGARQRFIKTVLRRGFRFVGTVSEEVVGESPAATQPQQGTPRLALPDKPSIAILPFASLSGDPDYFTDGIVEEIITGLSRVGWLFVIARNSSFTYKGRTVDVKQVGRELGVRYVLEGSLQKAADRVRITAQLIDAATGAHLSADRFDGRLEDIFDLQDQVTARVVGAISPRLEKAEIRRAKEKPTQNLDAYDHYLHGLSCLYQWTKLAHSQALQYFYRAIDLDPDFASPYGVAARCYLLRMANGWILDKPREIAETDRLCRRAVELGRLDAVALSMAGWALGRVVGDLDAAASVVDRALMLNPNLAIAWLARANVDVLIGKGDEAIEGFAHAMRLSPLDSQMAVVLVGMACAHFVAGRYGEAATWASKALAEQPNHGPAARMAAVSHALVGRPEKAAKAMARVREVDPELRISDAGDRFPFRRPEDQERLVEGLRRAGVPE